MKPKKPAKPKKNPNPPPQKVMTWREYQEFMKGRFLPEGWG